MKYEYSFETKYLLNGASFIIMRLPSQLELITSFLSSDVQSRHDVQDLLSAFQGVISGAIPGYQWAGNIYRLDISPTQTTIENAVDPDGEPPCVIETKELSEILEIWLAALERCKS